MITIPNRTFSGTRLAQLRASRNWSQARTAQEAGMPVDTLRDYERNRTRPSVDRLATLASVLGVTVDEMLGER